MEIEIADYLSAGWALCKIKPREKGAFEKDEAKKLFKQLGL